MSRAILKTASVRWGREEAESCPDTAIHAYHYSDLANHEAIKHEISIGNRGGHGVTVLDESKQSCSLTRMQRPAIRCQNRHPYHRVHRTHVHIY
jgi:hypothetical protein